VVSIGGPLGTVIRTSSDPFLRHSHPRWVQLIMPEWHSRLLIEAVLVRSVQKTWSCPRKGLLLCQGIARTRRRRGDVGR
jgi:hypothetical protein